MKTDNVPEKLVYKVEGELLTEEQPLWIGRPHLLAFIRSSIRFNSIAGSLVLVVIFIVVLLQGNQPIIFPGVVILFSFASVFVPILYRFYRTHYALTNRRAIIFEGPSVHSVSKENFDNIIRKTYGKSYGDLILRYEGDGFNKEPVGFLGIAHVREIETLMLETFQM